MTPNFKEEKEYFDGLLIEGSPYELSQHISRILASGAHFQFIDGEVIEVIRPGKDEVVVWNSGATYSPPVEVVAESRAKEKVEPLQELAPTPDIAPILTEAVVVEAPGLVDAPPVEEVVEPTPEPKPRGRKPSPKAVEAEEAPAKVIVPTEVEEN